MLRTPDALNSAEDTLRELNDKVKALIPLIKTTGFTELKSFDQPWTTCETWAIFLSFVGASRHLSVWKESVKKLPKSISFLEEAR